MTTPTDAFVASPNVTLKFLYNLKQKNHFWSVLFNNFFFNRLNETNLNTLGSVKVEEI